VHGCLHSDVCAVSYVEVAASTNGAKLMEELAMAANGGSAMERNDCKLVREANGDRGKLNSSGSDDFGILFSLVGR